MKNKLKEYSWVLGRDSKKQSESCQELFFHFANSVLLSVST